MCSEKALVRGQCLAITSALRGPTPVNWYTFESFRCFKIAISIGAARVPRSSHHARLAGCSARLLRRVSTCERLLINCPQKSTRSESCNRRAAKAETGRPKNGELRLPTIEEKLTQFGTLKASAPSVALGPFSFLDGRRKNCLDNRKSKVFIPGPSRLFLLTPTGRSLAMLS